MTSNFVNLIQLSKNGGKTEENMYLFKLGMTLYQTECLLNEGYLLFNLRIIVEEMANYIIMYKFKIKPVLLEKNESAPDGEIKMGHDEINAFYKSGVDNMSGKTIYVDKHAYDLYSKINIVEQYLISIRSDTQKWKLQKFRWELNDYEHFIFFDDFEQTKSMFRNYFNILEEFYNGPYSEFLEVFCNVKISEFERPTTNDIIDISKKYLNHMKEA